MTTTQELTQEQKTANAESHWLSFTEDGRRCVDCETAAWNAWRWPCGARG